MADNINEEYANDHHMEMVARVEGLFPPDSEYADTAKVGVQIMMEAIAVRWRDLPTAIIETMAVLCEREENFQTIRKRN